MNKKDVYELAGSCGRTKRTSGTCVIDTTETVSQLKKHGYIVIDKKRLEDYIYNLISICKLAAMQAAIRTDHTWKRRDIESFSEYWEYSFNDAKNHGSRERSFYTVTNAGVKPDECLYERRIYDFIKDDLLHEVYYKKAKVSDIERELNAFLKRRHIDIYDMDYLYKRDDLWAAHKRQNNEH